MQFDFNTLGKRDKWFVYITLFYIGFLIFPVIPVVTNIPLWAVSIGTAGLLFLLYPSYVFQSRFMRCFWIYIAVLFMYCLVGHKFWINGLGENSLYHNLLIETAWTLPNLLICNVLLINKDKRLIKIIGLGSIALLFISFTTVLPTLMNSAGILRENLRVEDDMDQFNPMLPSYTLMSAYSFFFPVLCYGVIVSNGRKKAFCLIMTAILFYVIYKTEITTSLLAVLIMIIYTLTYRENVVSMIFVSVVMGLIIILLYQTGIILMFVEWLQRIYDGTVVASKLQGFHDSITGEKLQGNDIEVRIYYRQVSWDSFLHNPFWGGGKVMGHSSIIDRMGSMGLLGFIPWIIMLIDNVKTWYYSIEDKCGRFFYLGGIFIVFIFLYNKGLFSCEGFLFMIVILPSSIMAIKRL